MSLPSSSFRGLIVTLTARTGGEVEKARSDIRPRLSTDCGFFNRLDVEGEDFIVNAVVDAPERWNDGRRKSGMAGVA